MCISVNILEIVFNDFHVIQPKQFLACLKGPVVSDVYYLCSFDSLAAVLLFMNSR